MLSTKSIRNLNKVRLYLIPDKAPVSETVFEAYLKSGNNLNLGIKTGDAFEGVSQLLSNATIANLFQEATRAAFGVGVSTTIDVQRKITFMGAQPMKFNLECTVFIENSYEDDVINPVLKLLDYILPSHTGSKSVTKEIRGQVTKFLQDKRNEHDASVKAKDGSLSPSGGMWGLAQKAIEWFTDWVGDVYLMNRPKQFESNDLLALSMPGLFIPSVFITNVNLGLPYVTYVDETSKEVIERVDISLSVESNRVATTDSFLLFKDATVDTYNKLKK